MDKYNAINYVDAAEDALDFLMARVDGIGEYYIAVRPNDEHWDKPLPDEIKKLGEFIKIAIVGWTRENSYYDTKDEVLYVKTAFMDSEYSGYIPLRDIVMLISPENVLLYTRTYDANEFFGDSAKFQGIPKYTEPEDDSEAMTKSMDAMLKNNPHLIKRKKGG